MGFFSNLVKGIESNETLWKRSLVKDLILLSAIDGEIDQEEVADLLRFCAEVGVEPKDFQYVLQNMKKIEAVYPELKVERFEYIMTLIKMTYSDGYIDDNEVELMMAIAKNMGLDPDAIPALIQKIEDEASEQEVSSVDGGMRLEDAEVDIMAIVKNNRVFYVNTEADHLFELDKDGDMKLDGRVVNISLKGQSDDDLIEFFVAFDDQDSYAMFTLNAGRDERLNYVANAIFKEFSTNNKFNLFTDSEGYFSQYEYTFKLYQKGSQNFLINNSQTSAYLIDTYGIKRAEDFEEVDKIKSAFWGRR